MQYPDIRSLTPRGHDEHTICLIKAFLEGHISCPTLINNGILARIVGATRIVTLKNPSKKILDFIKDEGYFFNQSPHVFGAIDIAH